MWIVADEQVRVCDTSRLSAPFEALRIGLAVRPGHPDREARLMAPADVVLDLDPFPVDAAGPAAVRWRIAGETDWRQAPAAGPWLAERLPAGRHRIEVEVVSPSLGRLAVAERRFDVFPPWWRSPPVLALWIATALGLLALGYRGGLRALRRCNAELGRLVAERTAALAAQTDHAERSAAWARATFDESPVALFEIDASRIGEAAATELPAIGELGAWSEALAALRLRAANRAALDLAATPDTDGCGRWLRALLRDGAAAFAAAFAELRDGRQTVEFACRSARATGSTLHLRIGLTALGGLPPRWERVLASAVDETAREARESERRQIEARIREAQRLQGIAALAGGLAHDFNNLMMAVRGNAEFVRARADQAGDDEVAAAIRSIDTAAAHAGDLCEQMLTFAGRGRWRADRVEPNRVLEEMVGVMRGRVPRAIDIEVDVGHAVPAIVGDRVQLGQVLMNLVGNAAEAIGDRPGAIVVRCRARALDRPLPVIGGDELAPGAYVEFEVEDDGHGIDAATCERIFEPFFTTRSEGRGLGLAAVLGIVRGHRGGLAVRSAADRGTVVWVLLPAAPAAIGAEPSPEGLALDHALRVAICDDDEAVRIATRRMLDHEGHSVETFEGGEGLLARLAGAADDFDVLLVDWVMPGIRGAELLGRLRAAAPRTPILVVSGLRDLGVETIGGIDRVGFLGKPFSRSRLAETLMAFLGPRRDAGAEAGAR